MSLAMRQRLQREMSNDEIDVPETFDIPSDDEGARRSDPNPFREVNQQAIAHQAEPSGSTASSEIGSRPRSASSDSEVSFFGDRAGFLSPPDTLSTSYHSRIFRSSQANGEANFLIANAGQKGFNLVINATFSSTSHLSQLKKAGFKPLTSAAQFPSIYKHPETNAHVTINYHTQANMPTWPEDVVFNGKNSAHERSQVKTSVGERWMGYRRDAAWSALGIQNIKQHCEAVGYQGHQREVDNVPSQTSVFSERMEGETTRVVPKNLSINAGIDGGNFLSNGAPRGERVYIIGLDCVPDTLGYMNDDDVSPADPIQSAREHLVSELNLFGNDRVIFVEQPTFHIDMTMAFVGANDVVLNSTEQREQIFKPGQQLSEEDWNTAILENAVERELIGNGINVIRKPWGGGAQQYNFFNGEVVTTNDDVDGSSRTLFLTNGYFSKNKGDESTGLQLQNDVAEFYNDKGIEVLFTPSKTAKSSLNNFGGIGCRTNSLYS